METIIVKPRNKQELKLVSVLMSRMKIPSFIQKNEKAKKQKAKEEFLNSLPERLNEVKLHMEGKINLKSWDELSKELLLK